MKVAGGHIHSNRNSQPLALNDSPAFVSDSLTLYKGDISLRMDVPKMSTYRQTWLYIPAKVFNYVMFFFCAEQDLYSGV